MKLKTSKSANKRITNITKNGKIMRRNLSAQHLVKGKSKRTLQSTGKQSLINTADKKKIRRLVPYR